VAASWQGRAGAASASVCRRDCDHAYVHPFFCVGYRIHGSWNVYPQEHTRDGSQDQCQGAVGAAQGRARKGGNVSWVFALLSGAATVCCSWS